MINIAADSQIPQIENRLGEFLNVDYSFKYFDSNSVSASDLKNIDALLVRSTLFVNQRLCEGTRISYVASATAGINHLDINYLDSQNIFWSHAPGCNAFSVIHYVMAAIGELIKDNLFNIKKSIGIVGYGNIGRRLYKILKALNFEVYACDPFLSHPELVDLDRVLECDLITIHVPLSEKGKHPTSNLINESHTKQVSKKILINTSRGEIISEALILQSDDLIYISDVWINEPTPSAKIIKKSYIATPHIAGYSIEAKHNGTIMILKNFCETNNLDNDLMDLSKVMEIKNLQPLEDDYISNGYPVSFFKNLIDVEQISIDFKESFLKKDIPFNNIRNNYELRNDFLGIKRTSETNKLSLFSNLYKNI